MERCAYWVLFWGVCAHCVIIERVRVSIIRDYYIYISPKSIPGHNLPRTSPQLICGQVEVAAPEKGLSTRTISAVFICECW